MALKFRITAVTTTAENVDLAASGTIAATAELFNDTNPTVVLLTLNYQVSNLPEGTTVQQVRDRFLNFFRRSFNFYILMKQVETQSQNIIGVTQDL